MPVHGNWAVTEACLRSLAAQTAALRVIVVDDASPDDTLIRLREHPEVDVVALATNSGFAAACNAGIRHGDGDVVVLVNNDVEADATMIAELTASLDASPRAGSAVPILIKPDGRVDAYGLCVDPTMAGFTRFNGATVAEAERAPGWRLLGPYGAVAAFRRTALDEVGLLDEGIFMYGEELDLAMRLDAAGWPATPSPRARGMHLGGATSGRASATQRRRSGFGRGYLLRAYGVLRGRHAIRAVMTEAIVCAGDLMLSRDLASTAGRIAGWRAGRTAARRSRRVSAVDPRIGFAESLRLRVGDRQA
ncbi:glycosyltransferase family 2 protein [Leifsonia aquatica]|uniref:glycosyltransferase family 2 protein n=1 Tax=Leifsonia aquatica TaxID=144185 RepID=UPI001F0586A4|nr:glycosyltransferase [Leifsonia aquatica]